MAAFQEASPSQIKLRLDAGERMRLLDVRERGEWILCRIAGAQLLPLSEIRAWQERLPRDGGATVLYCHHGVRSRWACHYLASAGIEGLVNLEGGIDRWAQEVDPAVPRY